MALNNCSDRLLFSVVMPVYNGEKFIEEAIKSVYEDKYDSFELLVIDDGSVDNTAKIVKSFSGIGYYYQENTGVASARNKGIDMATGDIISFLDSDDIWEKGRFEKTADFFKKHPETDYLLGEACHFLESGCEKPASMQAKWFAGAQLTYGTCVLSVRKKAFHVAGLFNENYITGEDLEWFLRAKKAGLHEGRLEYPVIKRRIHGQNLTLTKSTADKKHIFQMIRDNTNRKRLHGE